MSSIHTAANPLTAEMALELAEAVRGHYGHEPHSVYEESILHLATRLIGIETYSLMLHGGASAYTDSLSPVIRTHKDHGGINFGKKTLIAATVGPHRTKMGTSEGVLYGDESLIDVPEGEWLRSVEHYHAGPPNHLYDQDAPERFLIRLEIDL